MFTNLVQGPVDEKSNSSLSKTAIQFLRAIAARTIGTITPKHNKNFKQLQLTEYLENFNIRHAGQVIWRSNTAVLGAQLAGNLCYASTHKHFVGFRG